MLKDTWKGGAEHGGAGSRRFAWLFQPQVNRRTSPPRSLSATKREIIDVEIEVEILKNGIMSKGFKFAFQIRNKRRDQFDRISFKLKLFCRQILSEISGYDRGCSNLRIMDNQTGRILGMLDDVRGTQGQVNAGRCCSGNA